MKPHKEKRYCITNKLGVLLSVSVILTGLPTLTVKAAQPEQLAQPEQEQGAEVYGIGSVSKMFGTVAVMLLVDRGKVDLDAPVTDYIPEFEMADERYREITVRMLLNHSSGIMGTTNRGCFLLGDTDTDYQTMLLESLKGQKLKADPGEYSVYCNDGFTLAQIVVERVSGQSFGAFINEEFSVPLGLLDTCMPEDLTGNETLAPIYYQNRRLPYENIRSLASGGMYSTPEDLCRFGRIFTEHGAGILSSRAVESMSYPEYQNNRICVLKGDSNFNYGLGWDSVQVFPFTRYGIPAQSKGGDTGNYGAGLLVLPEQKLSIAVTAAGGGSEYCLLMAQEIATEVLLEEGLLTQEQIEETTTMEIDTAEKGAAIPEELKSYEGIYASGEIWRLEFTEHNTVRMTSLENNSDMTQEYVYTQSGEFVSTQGKYISYNNLAQAADGVGGVTSFHFSREANGKTYMIGTTYKIVNGKAQSATTQPFAEKIGENAQIYTGEGASQPWKERDGQKYYLVNDLYNSAAYLKSPSLKVELMKALPGYTSGTEAYKNCRIVDGDNAVCELDLPVMTGRDLADYHFYRRDGAEYLEIGSSLYVEAKAVPYLPQAKTSITLDALGQWYQIGDQDKNSVITIRTPEKGAYYVYDRNDECVTSSVLEGENSDVLLPEKGKLLLVGEEGSTFTFSY